MTRSHPVSGALLLSFVLSCAIFAQTKQSRKTSVVTPAVNMSGVLRSISDTEADLDGIDSEGHAKTFIFILTKLTVRQPCKKGDAVIIEFESHGTKLIATSIQPAGTDGSHSKLDPGGVGGVASAIPSMAAPALSRHMESTSQTAAAVTPTGLQSTETDEQTASASTPASSPDSAPPEPPQVPTQYTATNVPNPSVIDWSYTDNKADPPASPALTEELLTQLYPLTRTTADQTDIVTPGAVVTLHKDGLLMSRVDKQYTQTNTYKGGTFETSRGTRSGNLFRNTLQGVVSADAGNSIRRFVAGEKVWVTGVDVRKDYVVMKVLSDEYDGVRYHGELRFPIEAGSTPTNQALLSNIQEVVSPEPTVSPKHSMILADAAPAAPPPPPPADAPPPTIEVGQTIDQVIAILGLPTKIVDIGTKKVFYYPSMKIVFKNGKVNDVE